MSKTPDERPLSQSGRFKRPRLRRFSLAFAISTGVVSGWLIYRLIYAWL